MFTPMAQTVSFAILGALILSFMASGEIVQVLPEWEFISDYSGDLWLLWTRDKHMPARMRAMIDYLSEKLSGSGV